MIDIATRPLAKWEAAAHPIAPSILGTNAGPIPGDIRRRAAELVALRPNVGIRENTVKTRMFYVRKKLAEMLKAAGLEQE
jgi:hypothetical protein